jgi:hypothetical protein
VQLADATQAKHPNDHREQDMITDPDETDFPAADLAERVHHSRSTLRTVLRAQYDLIFCGSGFRGPHEGLLAAGRNLFNCK